MARRLSRKERLKIVESVVGKVPWDKFESGIYNYCDRWCERCDKTEKCYLFYEQEKENAELIKQGLDPNDLKVAFKTIEKSFKQTHELLEKISRAEDIDLKMSKEDEKEFEEREKQIDPQNDSLYKASKKLFIKINNWLKSVPPLDFEDYKDAYEKLSWHHSLMSAKICRALSGKKEAEIEEGDMRKFSLEDSQKSGWVAYRSTKICKESLEYMDQFVRDFRIKPMISQCEKILIEIDNQLL